MAYEPPPPFMPYEPFLLGVGVVFNLLSFSVVANAVANQPCWKALLTNFTKLMTSYQMHESQIHAMQSFVSGRGLRQPGPRQKPGNIPVTTTTKISSKVLRYKWEAYCDTNGRRTDSISLSRAWPRYCRKVYWTKMVQNGPNDHFGHNILAILA